MKAKLTPRDEYFDTDPDDRTLLVVELTRRNLETLLAKLDDPISARTLIDGDNIVAVHAVEDHDPEMDVAVVPVENSEHYKTRAPGPVYMPSTGETL